MKIAVAGATGRLGRHVSEVLAERGHEVVAISRATRVDIITGAGLDAALNGVEVIVDAATGPSPDQQPATEFFVTAAHNLQEAGVRAGVRRAVVVSIINIDESAGGYGLAKIAHEDAWRSGPIPVRIVRAAQFHEFVAQLLEWGTQGDVAYIPEMRTQIVSARTARGVERASALFGRLTSQLVVLTPEEAELAKLFTNTWRYIKFATANQLYMMANDRGLDFERIRQGMGADYPRAADMPAAGFAAGPCLFKDTMQLAAYNYNNFALGHTAMAINEGMPLYLMHRLEQRYDLAAMTVGICGMAFKGGSDDTRSSLSYKLKRILAFKAAAVLCTDPHVTTDPDLRPLPEVIERADLLVIAAPHPEYRTLATAKPVADIWNIRGEGVQI